MDFNPVDAPKHLIGADNPASGTELASTAGGDEETGSDRVISALKRS